jgi:hypothetical protein
MLLRWTTNREAPAPEDRVRGLHMRYSETIHRLEVMRRARRRREGGALLLRSADAWRRPGSEAGNQRELELIGLEALVELVQLGIARLELELLFRHGWAPPPLKDLAETA